MEEYFVVKLPLDLSTQIEMWGPYDREEDAQKECDRMNGTGQDSLPYKVAINKGRRPA